MLSTPSFVYLLLSLAAAVNAADYSDVAHRQQEFARAHAMDAPYLAERCVAAAEAAAARTVTRTTTIRSGATTKFSTVTKVSTVKTTTTLSGTTTSYKTTLPVKRSLPTGAPSTDFQKRAAIDEILTQYERAASGEFQAACRAAAAAAAKTVTKVVTVRRPTATVNRVTTINQVTTQVATKTVLRTVAGATRTPASAPKYVRCPTVDYTDPNGAFIFVIPVGALVAPNAGSSAFNASSYTLTCVTAIGLFPNYVSQNCIYDASSGKLIRKVDEVADGTCQKQLTDFTKVGRACDYIESCPYLPGKTLQSIRMGGGNPLPVAPGNDLIFSFVCTYDSGRCQYDSDSATLIGTNSDECPNTLPANRLQGYCLN